MGSMTYDPEDEVADEAFEKNRGKYKIFVRGAVDEVIDTIVLGATSSGGIAYRDDIAGTVVVYYDNNRDRVMLRGIRKAPNTWAVIYSTEFYMEPK